MTINYVLNHVFTAVATVRVHRMGAKPETRLKSEKESLNWEN